MKRKFFILSIIFFTAISCSDTVSYSELQDLEQKNIETYISKNNLKVVTTMPEANEWQESTYYKSKSGLYYHLLSNGDTTLQAKDNSIISVRFILSKIDDKNTVIMRNWDAQDFIYPEKLKLSNLYYNTAFGEGVNEALGYMKNYKSEAIILVESALNTDTYKNSVTPVKYKLKITDIR